MLVTTGLNSQRTQRRSGRSRAARRCRSAFDLLARKKVDRIALSGVPVASYLGRKRMLETLAKAEDRSGLPAIRISKRTSPYCNTWAPRASRSRRAGTRRRHTAHHLSRRGRHRGHGQLLARLRLRTTQERRSACRPPARARARRTCDARGAAQRRQCSCRAACGMQFMPCRFSRRKYRAAGACRNILSTTWGGASCRRQACAAPARSALGKSARERLTARPSRAVSFSPPSRSAFRSSSASRPTATRSNPSPMPAAARASCVMRHA